MTRRTPEAPLSQSIYRFVRATNRAYAFAVLWCYIGAFVIAFALMFVFPPGTLLLVFLGVFGLVAAVGGAHVLGAVEHFLARRLLRGGWCPRCGGFEAIEPLPGYRHPDAATEPRSGPQRDPQSGPRHGRRPVGRTVCGDCDAAFEPWGGEIESIAPLALLGTLGGVGGRLGPGGGGERAGGRGGQGFGGQRGGGLAGS